MQAKVILLLIFLFTKVICEKKLTQVVILSRHNVRTPLAANLAQFTPKPWPSWEEKSGYLTKKGAKLEGYMGKYFAAWLRKENLLHGSCPNDDDVYIYANIKQRTRASAQAFVNQGFPNCNVTVHYNDTNKMDPIFNPVIHNTTAIFKRIALEEMQEKLKSIHLNSSYEDMSSILDYKDSEMCLTDKKCNLITDFNKIIGVEAGSKPNIKGPLKISNSAIDAFIMEYYEGKHVAWGRLTDAKEWQTLMELSKSYHNVIFNTTAIAKDISLPLREYMTGIFLNDTVLPKIVLLMGHDANMYTILKGMDFKYYTLPNQYEITPVGGKIVFQRWYDENNKKYLLKINYIYQSSSQLRNAEQLTLSNPPQSVVLELKGCNIDSKGFCPWSDFIKLLKSLQ